MKAAIVNPYLDTLGGGERYSLAFATSLVKLGYEVDIQWGEKSIKKKIEERFGHSVKEVNIKKDIGRGDGYEVCFWVSDGSIPLLRARKNFLHFQIPFQDVEGGSLMNKMKLFRVKEVICNSYFTKKYVDIEYEVDSIVIYPPVDVKRIKPKRKENVILSVGRFSELKQKKGQDFLIEVFRKMVDNGLENWKLVLAGGTEVGAGEFLNKIKETAKDYPIEIVESPPFKKIKELYGKARIFWSASGFGVDESENPEEMEHFGITAVEAMAAKSVPLVFAGGGYKEIVADGDNGFLWKTEEGLTKKTLRLIKSPKVTRKLARQAREDSKIYEYERFEKQIKNLL